MKTVFIVHDWWADNRVIAIYDNAADAERHCADANKDYNENNERFWVTRHEVKIIGVRPDAKNSEISSKTS